MRYNKMTVEEFWYVLNQIGLEGRDFEKVLLMIQAYLRQVEAQQETLGMEKLARHYRENANYIMDTLQIMGYFDN